MTLRVIPQLALSRSLIRPSSSHLSVRQQPAPVCHLATSLQLGLFSFCSWRQFGQRRRRQHFSLEKQSVLAISANVTTTPGSGSRMTSTNQSDNGQADSNVGRVAICHMRSTNDKDANLRQVKEIVRNAKAQNAQMIFLPECCDFVGENRKQTLELAEPLTGDTVKSYRQLARENHIWISAGGIHEAILDATDCKTSKINNTHILIDNFGKIVARYRKLHLFDVNTPEFRFRESDIVERGDRLIVPVETPIGTIGLQICYDVRFPEASLILRKRGAEILTYPSAFAYSTGLAHWEILLRARAIENQCFVIAPAQIGWHNAKRQSYGHAMIVNPWGKIIAQCRDDCELDVAIGVIDTTAMQTVRQNMPCFGHRRNDIYTVAPIHIGSSSDEEATAAASESHKSWKFADFEIPESTIFYHSEQSLAFTNIRCVVPGHVLVATRRRTDRLKDLTEDEITDFFQTVCKVQLCTEAVYGTTSSTVTVQDGEDAGQTVKHVHCHIMPRKCGDFEHNDQIYIELNRHDHDTSQKRRKLDEMIVEAQRYREYFRNK